MIGKPGPMRIKQEAGSAAETSPFRDLHQVVVLNAILPLLERTKHAAESIASLSSLAGELEDRLVVLDGT